MNPTKKSYEAAAMRESGARGKLCQPVRLGVILLAGALSMATAQTAAPTPLTRLLGGATIEILEVDSQATRQIAGISAVIDDDAASGWTPPVGKTLVLIALPQDSDLGSVSLFAPGAEGRYQAFAGGTREEALAAVREGAAILNADIASQVPATPAGGSRGRFLALLMDLSSTAPLRSVDAIGTPVNQDEQNLTVVTPISGEQNAGSSGEGQIAEVNFAASVLGAKPAADLGNEIDRLIDSDTGTAAQIAPKSGEDSVRVTVSLATAVEVKRVSLAFDQAEGEVVFLATDAENPNGRQIGRATLDGASKTLTVDAPGISSESIIVEWRPKQPGTPLVVSELGVFALARVQRTAPGDDLTNRNSFVVQSQGTGSQEGNTRPIPPPSSPITPPPPIIPPPAPVSA